MIDAITSRTMRTTIDIGDPLLKELKRLQQGERKSLGRLVSDLLAQPLAKPLDGKRCEVEFRWTAKPTGGRVDLADKDALLDAMDVRRGVLPRNFNRYDLLNCPSQDLI